MPVELYHREWARRRIRHKVHLSLGGCLGPCALSNVALLLFAGHQIWFHSIAGDEQVIAIYDYIEAMVRADRYLPPPPALASAFWRTVNVHPPCPVVNTRSNDQVDYSQHRRIRYQEIGLYRSRYRLLRAQSGGLSP